MKRKGRRVRRLIILLAIILLILIAIIVILNVVYKNRDARAEFNDMKVETYAQMSQTMYMPNGIHALNQEYDGSIDLDDFYTNIFDFYNLAMDISKLKDKKIEKYYEKNENQLREVMGVTSLEEFKEIAQYISKYGELETFTSATIDVNSFKKQSRFLCFKMNFAFDSSKILEFDVMLRKFPAANVAYYDIVK